MEVCSRVVSNGLTIAMEVEHRQLVGINLAGVDSSGCSIHFDHPHVAWRSGAWEEVDAADRRVVENAHNVAPLLNWVEHLSELLYVAEFVRIRGVPELSRVLLQDLKITLPEFIRTPAGAAMVARPQREHNGLFGSILVEGTTLLFGLFKALTRLIKNLQNVLCRHADAMEREKHVSPRGLEASLATGKALRLLQHFWCLSRSFRRERCDEFSSPFTADRGRERSYCVESGTSH